MTALAALPTPVAAHLLFASLALALLIPIALMRRGTPRHRWLGRGWGAAMALAAATSFAVRSAPQGGFYGFSLLHLLAVWTLVSLAYGVWAIRAGRIRAHRATMIGLASGLAIAFLFTFLPGRFLGEAARSLLGVRPAAAADLHAPAPQEAGIGSLQVRVEGAPDPSAPIQIGLFAKAEDPARGVAPTMGTRQPPGPDGVALWHVTPAPAGRWTLAAFQDLNRNGVLDKTMFGVPSEPWALVETLTLGADPAAATLSLKR